MYTGCKGLDVEVQDKILLIRFNNPEKKNCLNRLMYTVLGEMLSQVATDSNITMVVFTGTGDYYTTGNDMSFDRSDQEEALHTFMYGSFRNLVRSFAQCPKLLVSLINGPCIGIGVTLAAMSDLVWCSETAYFKTPFTKFGIVPEAGSSYLFPLILGRSKATEMLLLSETLSAEEAYRFNFASKVFKIAELDSVIWPKLREFSNLPKQSLLLTKDLIRRIDRQTLLKAIDDELDALYERFNSEDFMNALVAFASRKGKSKL